jgi:hypothetical protein
MSARRSRCSPVTVIAGIARNRPAVPYVPALAVLTRALKITGDVKYYDSRANSGHTFSRGFCPNCGGRLFGKTSAMPRFMLITAGSLDDPSRFKPSMDFFTSSAQPWDHMNPELPKFPKQPQQ